MEKKNLVIGIVQLNNSGKGFYIYDENRNKSPDTDVENLIANFAEEKQIKTRHI